MLTRSSAIAKSTARPSCLGGVLSHLLGENLLMANQPLSRNGRSESYRTGRFHWRPGYGMLVGVAVRIGLGLGLALR